MITGIALAYCTINPESTQEFTFNQMVVIFIIAFAIDVIMGTAVPSGENQGVRS